MSTRITLSQAAALAVLAVLASLTLSACSSTPRKPRASTPIPVAVVNADLATEFSTALAGTAVDVGREGRHLRLVLPARAVFLTDTATVAPTAVESLAPLLTRLAAHRGLHVNIQAHTDSIGSQAFNQEFSRQRAAALRLWLMAQGVPDEAIEAHGLGEAAPLADNATPAGRERNRRIELLLGQR